MDNETRHDDTERTSRMLTELFTAPAGDFERVLWQALPSGPNYPPTGHTYPKKG
ncbi:hypothetical protein OHA69_41505 [Streptomyces anulatus]|uniref:hypothetical protein n=1 Tax=Streptomyces anulatus TaxID=1892 RepID=UPI002250820D|nr:hypothetical protein [Streptomyces anulatus]MCX4524070.1 hypothetical protein [Streptomyces anulatus]